MDANRELELLAIWAHSSERQVLLEERLTHNRGCFTTAKPRRKMALLKEIKSLINQVDEIKSFNAARIVRH